MLSPIKNFTNRTKQKMKDERLNQHQTKSTKTKQSSRHRGKTCNVTVVLRCRPLSSGEKRVGAPCILSCLNSREIEIRKSGGRHGKLYTFDKVLNPKTTQPEVFKGVVEPLVKDVLAGFNCTVFAYGQTGTGKTYTMEGRLTSDSTHRNAGVIPRAINAIFERLNKKSKEFSVKVSFMELYNEELSDLLKENQEGKLRIFEDPTGKKGMMVHGLNEVLVNTAEEVYALLKKSSERRRTAETKLNKQSSRSHCVFTVTIHIKESQQEGDDIIKTGKLFLIDLAGSECVGKSGVEGVRAKEAGKINQSLLTLGRVINALVEKTGYIPYRDSKLTRLLQESLGGRSKTVIIATVSPSQLCIEETASTLDYAHRAKNIKNRPQVNQKTKSKAYMRELLVRINDLKAENLVLREKNGIFLSEEKFNKLSNDLKDKTEKLEETDRLMREKDAAFAKLTKQFQDTSKLLEETEATRQRTQKSLDLRNSQLQSTKEELKKTTISLTETKYLVTAYQKTEKTLLDKGEKLKDTLEKNIQINTKLHAKIDRKGKVESHNLKASEAFRKDISNELTLVQNGLGEFCGTQQTLHLDLDSLLKNFVKSKKQDLNGLITKVEELSSSANCWEKSISELMIQYKKDQTGIVTRNAEGCLGHQTSLRSHVEESKRKMTSSFTKIQFELKEEERKLAQWNESLSRLLTSNSAEVTAFFQDITAKIDTTREKSQQNADRQEKESKATKELIDKLFQNQDTKANERITSMVEEMEASMAREMQKHIRLIKDCQKTQQSEANNVSSELKRAIQKGMEVADCEHGGLLELFDDVTSRHNEFHKARKTSHTSIADKLQKGFEQSKNCSDKFQTSTSNAESLLLGRFNEIIQKSQERVPIIKSQEREELVGLDTFLSSHGSEVSEFYKKTGNHAHTQVELMEGIQRSLDSNSSECSAHITQQQKAVSTHKKDRDQKYGEMQEKLRVYVDESLKADVSIGMTPEKKTVFYPKELTGTKSHFQLLSEFRKQKQSEEPVVKRKAEVSIKSGIKPLGEVNKNLIQLSNAPAVFDSPKPKKAVQPASSKRESRLPRLRHSEKKRINFSSRSNTGRKRIRRTDLSREANKENL